MKPTITIIGCLNGILVLSSCAYSATAGNKPILIKLAAPVIYSQLLSTRVNTNSESVYTDKALTGLKGVYVCVEEISSTAKKDGLNSDQVKVDTELKLRTAGIVVFDKMSVIDNHSGALLDVSIDTSKRENGMYVYAISLKLMELTYLIRPTASLAKATTWSSGSFGTVGTDNMPPALRQTVCDQVDKFANDYLAQNPK